MLLDFREAGAFEVRHGRLAWPWIAFDPARTRFASPSGPRTITVRALVDGRLADVATFTLPLSLPTQPPTTNASTAGDAGLHAFALAPAGDVVAATGVDGGERIVCAISADGETRTRALAELLGDGFGGQAIHFDRNGERLWLAAERADGGRLALLDARTLDVAGAIDLPQYPPPALYELALHPSEDAVLLLAACGQDGTFARVARWNGTALEAVPTAMDRGMEPAGLAGFSSDGRRVFLVESDQLRAHAWPGLDVAARAEFDDDFGSSYAGMVVDDVVLVDGEDLDDGDDRVMAFDASTLERRAPPGAIRGAMWAGRLEPRALVTVTSKGDPARGRVMRFVP